jgi:putative MATE family efflux protein
MKPQKASLVEGSVVKALLRLSIPIVLINILQSMYQLTDMFWVGRIGPTAVAAVSLSFPMIFLLISLGSGFAIAGTVLVAQYTGQKAESKVNLVCGQTFLVMSVFSLALTVLGYFITPFIINLMSKDLELNALAIEYLQISFLGLFFAYAYIMFQSLFRGVGNVKAPLLIVLLTVTLNFILDPILITGWGNIPAYGVNGAAYATIITQGIAAILGIFLMVQGRSGIHLRLPHLRPVASEIRQIIKLGLPASAEQSTRALSMLMMMFIVTSFGVIGTAAYGMGARVLSFVIIPALGFSMATSTVVGQNIGAEKWERARETAHLACFIILATLTAIGAFLFFYAHELMEIFIPESIVVQNEGANFIRIISLTFGLIGVQQVVSGALRGGGSTLMAMLLAMTTLWIFRFPIAYVLSHHTQLEVQGVWWAFCTSNILAGAIAWLVLSRSNWMKSITTPSLDAEESLSGE